MAGVKAEPMKVEGDTVLMLKVSHHEDIELIVKLLQKAYKEKKFAGTVEMHQVLDSDVEAAMQQAQTEDAQ